MRTLSLEAGVDAAVVRVAAGEATAGTGDAGDEADGEVAAGEAHAATSAMMIGIQRKARIR
ncbi:MAG: hypothetical protein M3T56_06740 [Chloroflexota bacterium]|nr:hypothetical protein [Chloroflexota bacterium]